jgi:lipoyl(octanoyl) transferase
LSVVPYREAWEMQRTLAEARAAGDAPDTLVLLEHPDVYTAGRRTTASERPTDGTDVIDVDRGGKITWHGPGQLVGYPVVLLPRPLDVVAYVRALESALIEACGQLGVQTRRVDGRTGVWTSDGARKIAAIGVRVRRRVAFHGFALNCCPDLTAFDRIVPCGITDGTVTSLSVEQGRRVEVSRARPVVEAAVVAHLTGYLATGDGADGGEAWDTSASPAPLTKIGLELVV